MGHLNIPHFNLVEGHAYSIMGVHELVDQNKTVQYRLIRINNPHGNEGKFNGSWADNDPKWATYRSQVPIYTMADDGQLFMEVSEFVKSFEIFMINYINDTWKINTHRVSGDDGKAKSYFFRVPRTQDIFIGLDVYSDRFYPFGCKNGTTELQLMIMKETEILYNYKFSSRQGYGWVKFSQLTAGNYTAIAIVNWQDVEVKEYTVTINSADEIGITNVIGDKETIKLKPTDDIRTSLIPDFFNSVNLNNINRTLSYSQLNQSFVNVDPKSSIIAANI